MADAATSIAQWANDAFRYGCSKDIDVSAKEWGHQSRHSDFTCVVESSRLVLLVGKCAVSTGDINVAMCPSYLNFMR